MKIKTLRADDPRATGLPTVQVGPDLLVDTLAMKESGLKWGAVASATGLPQWDAVVFGYVVETVRDPGLKFEATPENVKTARDSGLRWLRIAVRADLPGEGTAKTLYAKASGIDPATTYVGKGRYFAEAREGAKKIGEGDAYLATVKTVRKTGTLRGDESVRTAALETLAEAAKPKRTARKAK